MHRLKGHAGFTLIELMLVIMVIGILTLVGIPKYSAVKTQYKLEAAAQKVVSQLDYARQMAIDHRADTYVVFQRDSISVFKREGAALDLTGPAVLYEGEITFDPDQHSWLPLLNSNLYTGTPLGRGLQYNFRGFTAQNGNIILQAANGQTIYITVSEKTGRIMIQ